MEQLKTKNDRVIICIPRVVHNTAHKNIAQILLKTNLKLTLTDYIENLIIQDSKNYK